MIPNITRGAKMTGLVSYLAGPGRSNEHENPHVVAGHVAVLFAAPAGELSHSDAIELAHEIDTARIVFGTEVSYTNRRKMNAAIDDGTPRSVALADATSDRNVWHCSLSLNPDEGELSDATWGAIAAGFMREMGFDDPNSPRPAARWVAIRHGKTTAGGDHIHIAASAVREDGTKVDTFNDFKRAQAACGTLERAHGLVVLPSRENDRGTRGVKPAEAGVAARSGAVETARARLERTVRACATASKTEGEFVWRLRAEKVLVRPRYDTGTTGSVVGFSVATTPTAAERAAGGKPVWFGGGRLAKDLTLPRLRDEWETTGTAQQDAAAEWSAARRGGDHHDRSRTCAARRRPDGAGGRGHRRVEHLSVLDSGLGHRAMGTCRRTHCGSVRRVVGAHRVVAGAAGEGGGSVVPVRADSGAPTHHPGPGSSARGRGRADRDADVADGTRRRRSERSVAPSDDAHDGSVRRRRTRRRKRTTSARTGSSTRTRTDGAAHPARTQVRCGPRCGLTRVGLGSASGDRSRRRSPRRCAGGSVGSSPVDRLGQHRRGSPSRRSRTRTDRVIR